MENRKWQSISHDYYFIPNPSEKMIILSWNVAGLSTTVNRIHEFYPLSEAEKKEKKKCPLGAFFERHYADIVCLQEHKIPKEQLSNRSEPKHASHASGYESFWSCCVDSKKKGLNGVVTYAKQGTVRTADASPLGVEHLDRQGRCVVTDHGGFCLWNVYVPASGNGYAVKMEFLHALRRAVQQKRIITNKPQMLVGDLNISHTKLDIPWKERVVRVQAILDEVKSGTGLPGWKWEIVRHWETIRTVLATAKAIQTKTTNTITRQQFLKYRLAVQLPDGNQVYLGKHELTEEHCYHEYDLKEQSYKDPVTGEITIAKEANAVSIGILAELMAKIVSVQWNEELQRGIAMNEGDVSHVSPSRRWLNSILEEDGMVDPMRHFYPTAEARFTCWDQFTNQRYVNRGIRIDYTLIDKCLLEFVSKGNVSSLRSYDDSNVVDPLSEVAALKAATADGKFEPVSFEGGGITDVSQRVLDTQFGAPHTGMIYTPPSFSDHIAISLFFEQDDLLFSSPDNTTLVLVEQDIPTRKAQPHKKQQTIASFFKAGVVRRTTESTSQKVNGSQTSVSPNKRQKSINKNSILHHFSKISK